MTEQLGALFEPLVAQSAAAGALPILYAATAPQVKGGGYYGPKGLMELKGAVGVAAIGRNAKDLKVAAELWNVSEELTHVHWTTSARSAA
jgi:hypothetical protein